MVSLLQSQGIEQVYVNLGETRTLGNHPSGRPWLVGLRDPSEPSRIHRTIPLNGCALATSGGYGTRFDSSGHHHHIFDPVTGNSANHYLSVSVLAPEATTADALSTGLSALPLDKALECVESIDDIEALFILPDKRIIDYQSNKVFTYS